MNLKEAIEILDYHQSWRLGCGGLRAINHIGTSVLEDIISVIFIKTNYLIK